MCGVFGVVAARRRADRGRGDRGARPVRAPAPRPGIGRARGQRRRAADALQGPRDDQLGPRRAAAAEPPRASSRSPTAATRRPARRSGRTPSRRSGSGRGGRSRSATTATSSTPASCSTSCRAAARRLPASTDTELLTALLADEPAADTVEALRRVLPRVRGAYSLVVLDERRVIGVRDPFGFRPLVLGPAAARPAAGRRGRRPVARRRRRGRLVPLVGDGRRSTSSAPSTSATSSRARSSSSSRASAPRSVRFAEATPALCVFELIYFARPDSYMEGRNLYEARRRMGDAARRASTRSTPTS